jgi:hypothetical protein
VFLNSSKALEDEEMAVDGLRPLESSSEDE